MSVKKGLPVSGGSLLANRPEAAHGCVCKRFASGAGLIEIPAAAIRRGLRTRHIVPLLARVSGLGRWRWVVERTFPWLSQFRRLRGRYDKRADIHEAFLSLGGR
jgi:transposase